ncbi:hypothetical protein RO3G_10119 [Rhizopus delemar RA 99-880]|uniref:Uncharacterized protein n=1 Tax=Rhizopus delemar (strain RA 99-880 / ATCC MYA-4621 / FGSC 9543 / NRRL 43880) TaxID=246409 RepID=I1CAC9_RHIO9|nr:hypothetical protein RO3G_10119 [Rhizopus delemar RA 99-880]|eukprot:EIE85409.1 hypothetical protein RO3G_10119 [Rhizopus delemar RA 99-880]
MCIPKANGGLVKVQFGWLIIFSDDRHAEMHSFTEAKVDNNVHVAFMFKTESVT